MNNQGQAQDEIDEDVQEAIAFQLVAQREFPEIMNALRRGEEEDVQEAIAFHLLAQREFQEIMNGLRCGELDNLVIENSFTLLLENIDEVCLLLSANTAFRFVSLGHSVRCLAPVETPYGPLDLTGEQNDAWMRLLASLGRLEISCLCVGLGGKMTLQMAMGVFELVMPVSPSVCLCIPHHMKISSPEQTALLQALQQHHRHPFAAKVDLVIVGQQYYSRRFDVSTTEDSIVEGSPILNIVRQENTRALYMKGMFVTQKDCDSIARILSTGSVCFFAVENSTRFMKNGGKVIAEAIASSTSLEELHISAEDTDPHFTDDAMAKVLKNNYTLKRIKRGDEVNGGVAGAIASLNSAGRRYMLADNASFREHCMVKVLGKVSDNREAMFYHIRENVQDILHAANMSE